MHTRQTVRIIAAAAAGLLAFAVPAALQWEGFVCALVGKIGRASCRERV